MLVQGGGRTGVYEWVSGGPGAGAASCNQTKQPQECGPGLRRGALQPRAHLSSLVLRDRLRMHMQAAARICGPESDSAAAICKFSGAGGQAPADVTTPQSRCNSSTSCGLAAGLHPSPLGHPHPHQRVHITHSGSPAAAPWHLQAVFGSPRDLSTEWPGSAVLPPPAAAAVRAPCSQGRREAVRRSRKHHISMPAGATNHMRLRPQAPPLELPPHPTHPYIGPPEHTQG